MIRMAIMMVMVMVMVMDVIICWCWWMNCLMSPSQVEKPFQCASGAHPKVAAQYVENAKLIHFKTIERSFQTNYWHFDVAEIPLKCICSKPLCNGTSAPRNPPHLLFVGFAVQWIGFGLSSVGFGLHQIGRGLPGIGYSWNRLLHRNISWSNICSNPPCNVFVSLDLGLKVGMDLETVEIGRCKGIHFIQIHSFKILVGRKLTNTE